MRRRPTRWQPWLLFSETPIIWGAEARGLCHAKTTNSVATMAYTWHEKAVIQRNVHASRPTLRHTLQVKACIASSCAHIISFEFDPGACIMLGLGFGQGSK